MPDDALAPLGSIAIFWFPISSVAGVYHLTMIRPLQSARMRRGGFLSPVRGLWVFTSFTHGLRPFDRLRTGCGLRSVAASRLGPLPRGQEGRASTQYLTSFCGRMRRMSGWDAGALRWSFLSPLRGWLLFVVSIPTACAV